MKLILKSLERQQHNVTESSLSACASPSSSTSCLPILLQGHEISINSPLVLVEVSIEVTLLGIP